MLSRRTFVGSLTMVTAAAGLGIGGALLFQKRLAMADFSSASLEPLRDQSVTLRDAQGHARQATVKDLACVHRPATPGAPATEQISLVVAVDDLSVTAGTYRVENADLCLGDLYFSPVGMVRSDQCLEAVITRIV